MPGRHRIHRRFPRSRRHRCRGGAARCRGRRVGRSPAVGPARVQRAGSTDRRRRADIAPARAGRRRPVVGRWRRGRQRLRRRRRLHYRPGRHRRPRSPAGTASASTASARPAAPPRCPTSGCPTPRPGCCACARPRSGFAPTAATVDRAQPRRGRHAGAGRRDARLAERQAHLERPAQARCDEHPAAHRHRRADPRRRRPGRPAVAGPGGRSPAPTRSRRPPVRCARWPPGRSALRARPAGQLPALRTTRPRSPPALSAAALSEQAVIAYNAAKPPVPLAALYLEPAPLSLDYPYTIMPGIDPAKATAAEGLLAALRHRASATGSPAWACAAATASAARFAAADGRAEPGGHPVQAAAPRHPAARPAARPTAAAIDRVLSTWTAITLPARMLSVFDVSGSMLAKVPTRRQRDPDAGDHRDREARAGPLRRHVGRRPVDVLHRAGRQPGLPRSRADRPAVQTQRRRLESARHPAQAEAERRDRPLRHDACRVQDRAERTGIRAASTRCDAHRRRKPGQERALAAAAARRAEEDQGSQAADPGRGPRHRRRASAPTPWSRSPR